jgi:hypothetical protein
MKFHPDFEEAGSCALSGRVLLPWPACPRAASAMKAAIKQKARNNRTVWNLAMAKAFEVTSQGAGRFQAP